MSDLLDFVKSWGGPAAIPLLSVAIWVILDMRNDIKDIRDNHLVSIYKELGVLSGRTEKK